MEARALMPNRKGTKITFDPAILSQATSTSPCHADVSEAKDLLRCSSQPILQAVLDSPTVQRSRSFGFAETVSKHAAARVARLRMARRGGEMDR